MRDEFTGTEEVYPKSPEFPIPNESFANNLPENANESLLVLNTEDLESKPIPAVPSTKLKRN